jgi:Asp-tRNA(Asn)/Glu-tRNA(Gln) amidotransferase A subunit family amidase
MSIPETAREIAAAIASRQLSAVEVCRATLDRISRLDSRIHAFLHVDEEGALARAAQIDRGGQAIADVRTDAQPLVAGPQSRRIKRRIGGGGRRRDGAARAWF